jgi:threonine aldolase
VERLAEDHANARAIAETLADAVPGAVAPDEVETNIVVVDVSGLDKPVPQIVAQAKDQGVLIGGVGATVLRIVTHLDASAADCRKAAETLAGILR